MHTYISLDTSLFDLSMNTKSFLCKHWATGKYTMLCKCNRDATEWK